ncbi:hypothetical protein ACFE04_008359 [Oxalis oulophora]
MAEEFDDLLVELKAAGSNCNELESVATLISTLPAEFDPLIASFGEIGKQFPISQLRSMRRRTSRRSHSQVNRNFRSNVIVVIERAIWQKIVRRRRPIKVVASNSDSKKSESSLATVSFMAETKSDSSTEANLVEPNFIELALDSGTSDHMSKDKSQFAEFVELKSPTPVLLAGDKGEISCVGIGNIQTKSVNLKNVRYVPKLRRNLLSVSAITANGFRVIFSADYAEIVDFENNVVLTAHRVGRLYFVKLEIVKSSKVSEVNLVENTSFEVVHRRLAHLNEKSIAFFEEKWLRALWQSNRPQPSLNRVEPVIEEEDSTIVDDDLEPVVPANDDTAPAEGEEPEAENLRRSDRARKTPTYLKDYEVSMNICEALLCDSNAAESDDGWKDAKKAELDSMKKHDVWTLVPKRENMKVIRTRWVLRTKENGKKKARLVATGWDWTQVHRSPEGIGVRGEEILIKKIRFDWLSPKSKMTEAKLHICELAFSLTIVEQATNFFQIVIFNTEFHTSSEAIYSYSPGKGKLKLS